MPSPYLLAQRTISPQDLESLAQWLGTDPWLTQGALVRRFEERWAAWLGCAHALFVNSGSSANLLMYAALQYSGRLRNRKVVVPAVAWSTSVAPAIQLGFEPLLCEADPDTYGLDPQQLEELVKLHNPGAVVVVHVLGVPAKMDQLLDLQKRYGFVLMEDACAATGSRWGGKPVGTFGTCSTFSFFYGHHLSTIEGGMVCTNDEALYHILLQIRSHGWGKDLPAAIESAQAAAHDVAEFNRPFTFYHPGFNVRSSDLNAHIGLSQMERAEQVVRRRMENHRLYQGRFQGAAGFHCQSNPKAEISSISFAVCAQNPKARNTIATRLRAAQIETRPLGGGNMSRQPFWTDRYGPQAFPVADRIHDTAFQLPNHPGLSPADISFICDTVLSVPEA